MDLQEAADRFGKLLLLGTVLATMAVEMKEAVVVADFFDQVQFPPLAKQLLFGIKNEEEHSKWRSQTQWAFVLFKWYIISDTFALLIWKKKCFANCSHLGKSLPGHTSIPKCSIVLLMLSFELSHCYLSMPKNIFVDIFMLHLSNYSSCLTYTHIQFFFPLDCDFPCQRG